MINVLKYLSFLLILIFYDVANAQNNLSQLITTYFPNGKKKSEGKFQYVDKKFGIWTTWYSDGQVKTSSEYKVAKKKNYIRWEKHQRYKRYHPSEHVPGLPYGSDPHKKAFTLFKKMPIIDTKQSYSYNVGEYISYYDNGREFCHFYFDPQGNPIGTWKTFYCDGQLNSYWTANIKKRCDTVISFYQNRQICMQIISCNKKSKYRYRLGNYPLNNEVEAFTKTGRRIDYIANGSFLSFYFKLLAENGEYERYKEIIPLFEIPDGLPTVKLADPDGFDGNKFQIERFEILDWTQEKPNE